MAVFKFERIYTIFKNDDGLEEIGFNTKSVYDLVLRINESINVYCHSKEDSFMMELLASITKNAISKNIIVYEDLYLKNELEYF